MSFFIIRHFPEYWNLHNCVPRTDKKCFLPTTSIRWCFSRSTLHGPISLEGAVSNCDSDVVGTCSWYAVIIYEDIIINTSGCMAWESTSLVVSLFLIDIFTILSGAPSICRSTMPGIESWMIVFLLSAKRTEHNIPCCELPGIILGRKRAGFFRAAQLKPAQ